MAEAADTTTTDTTTTTTTTETAPPWHGYTAPEDVAYVENKGWKAPQDVLKSYRGAEKLIGRDPNSLVAIPRADDTDGIRAIYSKLGMPETPDKYELDQPQGMKADENYQKFAREAAHKVGLTKQQLLNFSKEHNAYVKSVMDQQERDYKISVDNDKAALLNEWKGGHERMMNAAQTAAKALGFTGEMIDAMERASGYANTMKFLAGLGQKLGEDGFVTATTGGGQRFGETMTPAEARAEFEAMKLDPNVIAALRDKMHPAHKAAQEKQNRLFAVMYPS